MKVVVELMQKSLNAFKKEKGNSLTSSVENNEEAGKG